MIPMLAILYTDVFHIISQGMWLRYAVPGCNDQNSGRLQLKTKMNHHFMHPKKEILDRIMQIRFCQVRT